MLVLGASGLPPAPVAEQLAQARQGITWHPGNDVRLELLGKIPSAEREKTIEALSAAIAKRGYRISPRAKLGVRLNIGVEEGLVVGKVTAANDPNYKIEHYEQGKVGKVRVSVVDAQGEPLFASPFNFEIGRSSQAGGEQEVWRSMRAALANTQLPRIYLRDAQRHRLPLSMLIRSQIPLGIDGLYEPPPASSTPTDEYALPMDQATQ